MQVGYRWNQKFIINIIGFVPEFDLKKKEKFTRSLIYSYHSHDSHHSLELSIHLCTSFLAHIAYILISLISINQSINHSFTHSFSRFHAHTHQLTHSGITLHFKSNKNYHSYIFHITHIAHFTHITHFTHSFNHSFSHLSIYYLTHLH